MVDKKNRPTSSEVSLKNRLIDIFPELIKFWNIKQLSSRKIELLPNGYVLDIDMWNEFTAGDGERYRSMWTVKEFVGKEYWRLRKLYFHKYLF